MTLRQFQHGLDSIPTSTSWYLAELGESRGKQELYTRQAPQRLATLREHAIIESAVSSNRIEGVQVDKNRIGTILFGKPYLHDRSEEEVSGYRKALDLIHQESKRLDVNEKTILELHRLSRGEIWDAGKYKEKDWDIIEKYPDGRSRVRFKTVAASDTPAALRESINLYGDLSEERKIPELKTRNDITRPWNIAHKGGMRVLTIHGLTSISFFLSLRRHTKNSKSISAKSIARRARRKGLCSGR